MEFKRSSSADGQCGLRARQPGSLTTSASLSPLAGRWKVLQIEASKMTALCSPWILGFLVGACDDAAYRQTEVHNEAHAGPSAEAVSAARLALDQEPNIVDLTYQPDTAVQWQIGVFDNGTSRIGYANYICELLALHDALEPDTHVRIVDIVKVNSGENFRSASLGHIRCRDRRSFNP